MRFEHRAIPIVIAAAAIDVIGFGIIMPVLPSLIADLGQADLPSATRIGGWLLATFALAQFFAGPIVGNLGDRFGRRPVLLACMVCFAIDYAFQAFAPTLAWLFLGRAIAGVSGAMKELDRELTGREWLDGERYTIADIVLLTTIDFAAFVGLAMPEDLTALRDWHARASARPSAKA